LKTDSFDPPWDSDRHRLDNTGKMYPLIRSDWQTTLYRLTAVLNEPVDAVRLRYAVFGAYREFPEYKVVLKPGFFWYYFDQTADLPEVQPDAHYPCTHYERKFSVSPIHVYYKDNQLSAEFSHALTDGNGATMFFKALLISYFRITDSPAYAGPGTRIPDVSARLEDSYLKNYDPSVPGSKRGPKAFHFPYKPVSPGIYFSTTGTMPLERILKTAKSNGATITEWLTAFYISTVVEMIHDFHWEPAPVVLNVPVNLRKLYNSETLRNFFVTIMPSVNTKLGYFSFEEILLRVKNYMSLEVDKRYINQQFKRNVDIEKNMAIRLIPLVFKRIIFPFLYYYFGERQYSGGFSNLGVFQLPDDLRNNVAEIRLLVPPSPGTLIKAGCISYNDSLSVTFGSLANERELERRFFSGLRKAGIPVKLSVNY